MTEPTGTIDAWLGRGGGSGARGAAPAPGAGAGGAAVTFDGDGHGALTLGGEPWQSVGRDAAGAAGIL